MVANLLVGFFVVDEIGVVGFFVCVCVCVFSLGGSCSGYFLWLLVVIFGGFIVFFFFFFFSLGGFCGDCFLRWLLYYGCGGDC